MNNVRLISYTESYDGDPVAVKKADVEGLIAYCARVSNPSNQNNEATAHKLIKYLIKHKHWSPLEMVNVCIEIETTRDIGRQILRHRSFSFQEFSQRYADPVKELEFTTREARLQDTKNRQNSIDNTDYWLEIHWKSKQQQLIELARETYGWAITNGVAKEQARIMLPLSQYTKVWWTASFQSIMNFIELRDEPTSQVEIQEYARALKEIMLDIFPETTNLWGETYWK